MNILTFGPGAEELAKASWPEGKIFPPDFDIFLPVKKHKRKYNALVSYFNLQLVANIQVVEVAKEWRKLLLKGGEMHIIVPSAEWFAREILPPGKPSKFAIEHLFGLQVNQETIHLSAFTMMRLRGLIEELGMRVKIAKSKPYAISLNGETYNAQLHHVVGVK